MPSPFKAKEFDCVGRDIFDALTLLHDLEMWDEYVYDYADKPLELVDMIKNHWDEFIEKYELANRFSIILMEDYGDNKIQFIKSVRDFSGLGLAESKRISETLPRYIPWAYDSPEEIKNSKFLLALRNNKCNFTIQKIPRSLVSRCCLYNGERRALNNVTGDRFRLFNEEDFRKQL